MNSKSLVVPWLVENRKRSAYFCSYLEVINQVCCSTYFILVVSIHFKPFCIYWL